jgi:dihydrofolate reductase
MRRLILYVACSLDGFIAGPRDEIDWLDMDPDYDDYDAFTARIDTIIMGRRTYDVALGFGEWPYPDTRCIVMTRTPDVFAATIPANAHVEFTSDAPTALIDRLRAESGKDIWLMGGGDLIRGFLAADLIDEFIINYQPIILGGGLPLFPPGNARHALTLQSVDSYPMGMIEARYTRPSRAGSPD